MTTAIITSIDGTSIDGTSDTDRDFVQDAIEAQAELQHVIDALVEENSNLAVAQAIIANRKNEARVTVVHAMDQEEISIDEIARLTIRRDEKRAEYELVANQALVPLKTRLDELSANLRVKKSVALATDTIDRPAAIEATVVAYRETLVAQFDMDEARRAAGLETSKRAVVAKGEGETSDRREGGVLYRTTAGELHHKVYSAAFQTLRPIMQSVDVTPRGMNDAKVWGMKPDARHLNFTPAMVATLLPALTTALTGTDDKRAIKTIETLIDRCNRFQSGEQGDIIKAGA